ncbi:hypothetical protein HK100_009066 [Physocladia obscura]|uniref:Uncharacterized protein n=1 Tax=Physocladia obscura TaxID=109957 RepID=A0AAD5T4Q5_9FUNG|nr:hypothetical protein HK100_009066 [Physocladia obscura]
MNDSFGALTLLIQTQQAIGRNVDLLLDTAVTNLQMIINSMPEDDDYESDLDTIHGKLLQNDNIAYKEKKDGNRYAVLTPRGIYRRAPCFTTQEKGYETQFCPWKDLSAEMAWYVI